MSNVDFFFPVSYRRIHETHFKTTLTVHITDEKYLDAFTTESELMEIHLTTSTNRRERMSVLMALIICIGCIGALLILIHILLFLRVFFWRPSNQYPDKQSLG